MSDNYALKRNASSIQVLKTLKVLMEDNYTMSEIVERLNLNEPEPVFNNSVVSKYINTCRYCGIDIPKIHNKYFVASLPFGIKLTDREIELINKLQEAAKNGLASKSKVLFEKFINRFSKFSNRKIIRVEEKTTEKVYETFETAINGKHPILLMNRNKSNIECVPLTIVQKKDKMFFNVLYKNKEKLISLDRITGMQILYDKTFFAKDENKMTVFKLYGDMAKRYRLREYEQQTVSNFPEYITITNYGENREVLLSRLLRYDSFCEVQHPIDFRNEIKRTIDETLANYGE